MPISTWNEDGTVNIYNYKTGETRDAVKPEELASISPNLVKEYYEGMTPEAQTARVKSQQELTAIQGGTYKDPAKEKATTDLRSEYFTRTKENNFIDVTNNYGKIKSAPNTAAGDVSLIFSYMKLIDPASVVREGEFATAEQTAGIPQRLVTAYNKALKGKRLGDKQRADFLDSSTALYSQYQVSQKQIDDFYINLAKQQGLSPEDLGVGTIGYKEPESTLGDTSTAIQKPLSQEVPPTVAEAMAGKRGIGTPAQAIKKEEKKGGWLKDVAVNLVETALGMPGIVAEAGKQAYNSWLNPELKAISKKIENGTATDEELNKYIESFNATFIKQNELEQASESVGKGALMGAKKGAGTASFLVPGGGGTLGQVALRGGIAGAMYGAAQLGEDEEVGIGETLGKAAIGGATGAATGAAVYGAGKLLKPVGESIKKTIGKAGEKLGISAKVKSLGGVPKEKLGGAKLFNEMDEVGIATNNVDDLVNTASTTIKQNSDELLSGIEKAGGGKLEVTTDDVIRELSKMKDSAPTAKKATIQKAIDDITSDFGGGTMKLTDFYKLKQEFGHLGKWRPGSMMDDTQTGVYEKAYSIMNDKIDDALKAGGFEKFRMNNKAISTAIKALDFADDLTVKAGKQAIFNWTDAMMGGIGVVSLGPSGIGLPILNRILSAPATQRLMSKSMQKIGTSGLGPVGTVLKKGTEYIAPKIVSGQTTR